MIKRSLLAVTISTLSIASAHAAPYLPMDARGLAMGSTGVASAKRAHAPAYNPSLLSQAEHDDSFSLLLSAVGVVVADEDEIYDTFKDANDDLVPEFEALFEDNNSSNFNQRLEDLDDAADDLFDAVSALENLNNGNRVQLGTNLETANNNFNQQLQELNDELTKVNSLTSDLSDALNSISNSNIRGRFGATAGLAFPGKSFAGAITLNTEVTFSGRAVYSPEDDNLLNAYGQASGELIENAEQTTGSINTIATQLQDPNNKDDITAPTLVSLIDSVESIQNFNSSPVDTAAAQDIRIIENGVLSNAAEDPELNSELEVLAVAVSDVSLSFSREFAFGERKVALGITPKLQKITTFHYVTEADNDDGIDRDEIEDQAEHFTQANLDIGASFRLGSTNKWVVGVVGKNLIGKEFETKDVPVRGGPDGLMASGQTITLDPQWRAGVAFNGDITTLALDVDLVENDPIAFEAPTQYAALGAEVDAWDFLQLRMGYRTNMSVADSDVVSVGLGLSFGAHLDLALLANPNDIKKEAGFAAELGFNF
ncbi:MAG: conjugal transfer protein TraF [Oceanobacter sp.]